MQKKSSFLQLLLQKGWFFPIYMSLGNKRLFHKDNQIFAS
jgi:hypothetical protein